MYLRHLALANFRNYQRLDLAVPPRLSIYWGDNGQGKSNLLEAVYLLATTRSFRTAAERELVNWFADTEPVFARIAGEVVRHQSSTRLEVVLAEPPSARAAAAGAEPVGTGAGLSPASSIRRRVRINGHERPVPELLGHLNVVLFSPEDVDLVAGPAELRRRYLDITLCQVDQRYLRTLRRYLRVLAQRNALLRQLRERAAPADQFDYWDSQLVELAADLAVARLRAVALLTRQVADIHPRLTAEPAAMRLRYRSVVPLDDDAQLGERAAGGDGDAVTAEVRERYRGHLATIRPRERQQGVTLAGVHRDDLALLVGDVDLRTYGSRGQQRTAALALKVGQVALMEQYAGDRPLLLLDDVMSELDPQRRAYLQTVVLDQEQVLLSATDLSFFRPEFLERAVRFRVAGGRLEPS